MEDRAEKGEEAASQLMKILICCTFSPTDNEGKCYTRVPHHPIKR